MGQTYLINLAFLNKKVITKKQATTDSIPAGAVIYCSTLVYLRMYSISPQTLGESLSVCVAAWHWDIKGHITNLWV